MSDRRFPFTSNGEETTMTYNDRYNSEHYLDMTAYLAIRNIENSERKKSMLKEDWDFRRGDIYMADLGYGAMGQTAAMYREEFVRWCCFRTMSEIYSRRRWSSCR